MVPRNRQRLRKEACQQQLDAGQKDGKSVRTFYTKVVLNNRPNFWAGHERDFKGRQNDGERRRAVLRRTNAGKRAQHNREEPCNADCAAHVIGP